MGNEVNNFRTDELLIWLRKVLSHFRKFIPKSIRHYFPSVGKFVPKSSSYPSHDRYTLERDSVRFTINRSDYVQWRIFYGVRDNALKAAKNFIRSSSMILDIGANVGAFSLKLSKYCIDNEVRDIQIHCFEPNAPVYSQLLANLDQNAELKSVTRLHSFGLGNETINKAFHTNKVNSGASRIVPNGESEIQIKKLDDFISTLNPSHISFIKLIVEGYEPEVFKGGWETLKKFKPPIFFEVTPSWWNENHADVTEVLDSLEALGYQFKIEQYNELRKFNRDKDLNLFQYNLLALPS